MWWRPALRDRFPRTLDFLRKFNFLRLQYDRRRLGVVFDGVRRGASNCNQYHRCNYHADEFRSRHCGDRPQITSTPTASTTARIYPPGFQLGSIGCVTPSRLNARDIRTVGPGCLGSRRVVPLRKLNYHSLGPTVLVANALRCPLRTILWRRRYRPRRQCRSLRKGDGAWLRGQR